MNKNYPVQERYEDEIDLVDLIKMLIRNFKLIIFITVLITGLGMSYGFYLKTNENTTLEQRFVINPLPKLDSISYINIEPFEMFNDDTVVNNFFANDEFKKIISLKPEEDTMKNKRNILKKLYLIKALDKQNLNYSINVTQEKIEDSIYLIQNFFVELGEYIKKTNKNKSDDYYKILNDKLAEYDTLLEKVEIELSELIKKYEFKESSLVNPIEEIKERNPRIIALRNTYSEIYNETLKEKVLLDKVLLQATNNITYRGSIYELEGKVKLKLITIISFVLGGFLGIFAVFVKEFIKNIDWKN